MKRIIAAQPKMQQMNDLLVIMPQMMRSKRLIELAQARKCEWAPDTPIR